MINTKASEQPSILFGQNPFWLKASLLIMFLLATLVRLEEIRAPGHLLDREYTSAIFARAFYFTNNNAVEEWRRDIAVTTKNQQPVLEPPVLEYMVSLIYRLMGREDLVYSRYITNAFWLLGGIFMFLLARKLLSVDEAIFATAYYLFVPMGIIVSRSFQPDSLMMMLFLISLYLLVLYFDTPTTNRLFFAAILTGTTLLLRPLVIFALFCAFIAFSIHRSRNWKRIIDLPLITFSTVSLLPATLYYGYGILFAGFMSWKVTTSFMPYLLVKKGFWLGWFDNVVNVAEFMPLFLAIMGFFLIKDKKLRYLIIGLIISIMLFSVAFTYHIHTHPYYHIQLFPIVGLCLAPAIINIIQSLRQTTGKSWWVPVIGAFLFTNYIGYREFRGNLYQTRLEDPKMAWNIGQAVRHSSKTVFVSFYYGVPLEYYGEFGGAPWPVNIEDSFYRRPGEQELSVQERLDALGFTPEYFVITNFNLFDRKHQDLNVYLEKNCSVHSRSDSFLVYANCQAVTIE